jgi:hypothetical protein
MTFSTIWMARSKQFKPRISLGTQIANLGGFGFLQLPAGRMRPPLRGVR